MPRFAPDAVVPCALCDRDVPGRLVTLHHLKPKSRGGGAEVRVPVCKTCHKQVHALFTNKELDQTFRSIEALKNAERLRPFLAWVRKQKPDRAFTVATSTVQRRRRSKR